MNEESPIEASPPAPPELRTAGHRWSLAQLVDRIAASMAPEHATMPRAAFRRAAHGDTMTPAFWAIMAQHVGPAGWAGANDTEERRHAREQRWAVTLGAMAEAAGMHLKARSMGTALALAEAPEARVTALVRERDALLWPAVRRAVHLVASRGVSFDQADLASLLLSDEPHLAEWRERTRATLARDYFDAVYAAAKRGK